MHFRNQIKNIDVLGYNIEHTPTESSVCGSLMYISQDLSIPSVKIYRSIV